MAKMSKTQEEYLMNNGWSSALFLPHAKLLFEELKEVNFVIGRSVIYLQPMVFPVPKTKYRKLKAYVHHNGRTKEYVTFTDEKGNELETIHYTISPEQALLVVRRLLK
jgi:hypothetical protein